MTKTINCEKFQLRQNENIFEPRRAKMELCCIRPAYPHTNQRISAVWSAAILSEKKSCKVLWYHSRSFWLLGTVWMQRHIWSCSVWICTFSQNAAQLSVQDALLMASDQWHTRHVRFPAMFCRMLLVIIHAIKKILPCT